MVNLFEMIKSEQFRVQNGDILKFMALAFTNYSYPPDMYFVDLEIDKMRFSSTGSLKNIPE